MLDANQISPLLDDYIVGEPMSDHHGTRCCPAINRETEKKYIVKIISVPPSQTQIDALLLTGAVENETAAKEYFKERVMDYTQEIDILQNLSRHEGFLPCSDYQVKEKADEIGFDIYILADYRLSLERQLAKKAFTQLDALNLSLDICSALTACRRNGYLFVNLKPSNIYIADNGEYKISDFGFVKLKHLKYAALAEHYIGVYTAPEITDPFSALNEQMDVYALGMILYQIYNGGILPEPNQAALEAPAYADAELSHIILKACSTSPSDRWQDPAQMGQMIVSYMQKNGVQDIPIVPPMPEPSSDAVEASSEASIDTNLDIADVQYDDSSLESDSIQDGNTATVLSPDSQEIAENAEIPDESAIAKENTPDQNFETKSAESITQPGEDNPKSEDVITPNTELAEENASDVCTENGVDTEQYEGVSNEVNEILMKADSLAAMEAPEPVVAPEAKEVVLPDIPEDSPTDTSVLEEQQEEDEPKMEYYVDIPEEPRKSHWVRNLILIVLFLGLLVGGFLFYKFYILQTIDKLSIHGLRDQLTVTIESEIDEALLSVSCTDVNTLKSITVPVINGVADFSGLTYGSEYNIEVKVSGLHILRGSDTVKTTQSYWTPHEIIIKEPEVLTGIVPGSAVLNFTIDNNSNLSPSKPDPSSLQWKFTYSYPGADAKTVSFTGTTLTLTDLSEGKVYIGTLELENEQYISENLEIVFTPTDIIKANNLTITSCTDGKLTASWDAPETVKVDFWQVRCYNDRNYDKTITTSSTIAEFDGLNSSSGFTVEVTAAGQSLKQIATVGANSVTVSNISADTSAAGIIDLTWDASAIPANGWIITYDVSGCESVVRVAGDNNKAQLKPAIPGVTYTISIRSADTVQTLCKDFECAVPETGKFSLEIGNKTVTADSFLYSLCKRPDKLAWTYHDVATQDYTTKFTLSQEAAIVIFRNGEYADIEQEISVAFVVYDSENQIISIDSELLDWNHMWIDRHCHLNIPKLPNAVGKYTIAIYFNGELAASLPFTML